MARWSPWVLVDGVVTWYCQDRSDAVTIEGAAYVAWRGVALPDGGQTWERAGTFSSARAAMRSLEPAVAS